MNNLALLQSLCSYRKYHSFFGKTRVQRYLWTAHSGLFSAWKLAFLVCRVFPECNSQGTACPRWLSHVPPATRFHSRHYRDAHVMILTCIPLHTEKTEILITAGPGGKTACAVLHAQCALQDVLHMALGHRTSVTNSWWWRSLLLAPTSCQKLRTYVGSCLPKITARRSTIFLSDGRNETWSSFLVNKLVEPLHGWVCMAYCTLIRDLLSDTQVGVPSIWRNSILSTVLYSEGSNKQHLNYTS